MGSVRGSHMWGKQVSLLLKVGFRQGLTEGQALAGFWINNLPFGFKNIPGRLDPSHSFQQTLFEHPLCTRLWAGAGVSCFHWFE